MRIIAIWDRRRAAPESKATYCLWSDGQLIRVEPEGKTGDPKWDIQFGRNARLDFQMAHYIMCHKGGCLIWIESLDADTEVRP